MQLVLKDLNFVIWYKKCIEKNQILIHVHVAKVSDQE